MSDLPAEDWPTVLERWKALAANDNMRTRRIWSAPGRYVPPSSSGDPGGNAAHERRDAQAWAVFRLLPKWTLVSVVCPAMVGVPASDACLLKGAGCRLRFFHS